MEMVAEHYKVNTIHDVWPNLGFFVHGGVAFEPYKKGFEKLLGKPIVYIENYLSSEGFIGYKDSEHAKGMKLVDRLSHTIEAHYQWLEKSLGKQKLTQLYELLDELIELEQP